MHLRAQRQGVVKAEVMITPYHADLECDISELAAGRIRRSQVCSVRRPLMKKVLWERKIGMASE